MEPAALKRDFGKDVCFWGAGWKRSPSCHSGRHSRSGTTCGATLTPSPRGGYVFNTIHNIQADVPPENIAAMIEALRG